VVFYGGESGEGAAQIKRALVAAGDATLPFYGGDGIADDPSWIALATPQGAFHSVAVNPGPDISRLSSTAVSDFMHAYTQAFPGQLMTSFTLYGYDAAMIEITVLEHVIHAGIPVTRGAMRAGIAHLVYDGLTGTISFDANGDNAGAKIYTVYQTDGDGKWEIVRLISA
jgi:ABC-type branched-subunit amino acid transport system substrate-binding protein